MKKIKDSLVECEKYQFQMTPVISIKRFRNLVEEGLVDDVVQEIINNSSESSKLIYEKWKKEEMIAKSDNPYEELEFGDRLEIKEAVLHITDSELCDSDGCSLEKIQVVIRYKARHSYGLITECCRKCKRLFMKRTDYDEYQTIFDDKGIKYEAIQLEGSDEKE